jgi:hypothetical protein
MTNQKLSYISHRFGNCFHKPDFSAGRKPFNGKGTKGASQDDCTNDKPVPGRISTAAQQSQVIPRTVQTFRKN